MNRPIDTQALTGATPSRARATTHQGAPFRSHAQSLEDVSLWRALRDVRGGRYIDIGAYDPWLDSVSAGFAERGWSGVSVDPLPGLAERYAAERPDTEFLPVAISDQPGEAVLARVEGTGQSSIDGPGGNRVLVPTMSLSELFDRVGEVPVHWLKIDVEGHEAAVLRSWGDHGARPWIVCLEHDSPLRPEWEGELLSRGYHFARADGLNRFYLHDDQAARMDALRTPPHVGDGFLITQYSGLSELPATLDSLRVERDSLKRLSDRLDAALSEHAHAIRAGNSAQDHLHATLRLRDARIAELEARPPAPARVPPSAPAPDTGREARLLRRLHVAEDAHRHALAAFARELGNDRKAHEQTVHDRNNAWDTIARLDREIDYKTAQLEGLTTREAHLEDEVERHRAELRALQRSTSWRLTAPLRRLTDGAAQTVRAAKTPKVRGGGWVFAVKSFLLDQAITHWRRDYKLLRPLRLFVLRRPALGRRLSMRPDHWDDSYKDFDPFDPDPAKTAVILAEQRASDTDPNRYKGPDRNARPRPNAFAPLSDVNALTRGVRARQRMAARQLRKRGGQP